MNEVVIPLKIQGIAQMKAELRELKGSIASATDPAQMAALAQQAGVLSDKIKDANDAVAVFASGSKFEQVSNGLGGIKDSLMSLDFEEAAEKSKTFATALGGINKTDITKSMKGMVDMTKTLSGAFLKLGMTILMNPIFLIVAAVVAIIAVIALVLKSFGVLDDVIKAMMMPINMLIAGFKALTDWLGLTAFAAEDNAAKTLAANEKVTESSKERTASMTADLGREIAEAKAAGEDTTKLEQEKSNVQIKEADKRRGTAYKAIAAQRKLGDDADQETIKKLKKQIIEETEIIKQGYSDKKVAKLNDIKADAAADATAAKEAAARAKQYASDRLNARRDIRKQEIGLAGSDMEQERLTIINDHKVKLEDIKNNAALTKAEKIRLQELENQLFEEKKIDFTAKQIAIDKANKDAEANAMAASHTANIAKIDAYNARLSELTDTEEQKLYDKYAADLITFEGNELALFNIKKKYEEDITALKKTEADKQKAITDKARAEEMAAIKGGLDTATDALNGINSLTNIGMEAKLKNVKKGSKEEEKILRKQFKINKAMQLAMAAINGAQSILAITATAVDPTGITTAIRIAATVAATAASIATIAGTQFGGGGSAPTAPDVSGGGESTTAVAPAAAPQLFGQANTGSQVNAGGGTNNITVTAVVSETEITSSQNHINNIQNNSVL
jgi:hypothetical protein